MVDDSTPSAIPQIIFASGDTSSPPDLRLLHYNDVYHIDHSSAEPVGGIARFMTLCKHYREGSEFAGQSELLTFFSGDAFNPSLESSVTKGSHMVPVLNRIGTDVACVGNHDLDFGIRQYRNLSGQCTFPWLLANVLDPALGDDVPLGNSAKTSMLTSSNGIKIGVIGLAEREWLDTINSLPPNVIYQDAVTVAKKLAPQLLEQGAEMIVAVTHQREPNDNKLAEETPGGLLDLILGGHDHFYQHTLIKGTHVLRSGTDFKQLSYIEARRMKGQADRRWDFRIIRRDVMSSIEEDPEALKLTEKLGNALKTKLEKPLGYTASPLDARFTTVRLKESNMGNFVCDLMRTHYGGDCCIIASGTIRGDQIYPPGLLRVKDIMNCFPFEDPCVVLKISGQAILEALENSVSTYPALEGRFPQVSNIKFHFDPQRAPRNRIQSPTDQVTIGGKPLDLKQQYVVVTRGYMARGKDGFTSLLARSEGGVAEEIVSEENGMLISTLLRQYFISLKTLGLWRMWGKSIEKHWKGVQGRLHELHPVLESNQSSQGNQVVGKTVPDSSGAIAPSPIARTSSGNTRMTAMEDGAEDSDDEEHTTEAPHVRKAAARREKELALARRVARKWRRVTGLTGDPQLCDSIGVDEFNVDWTRAIAPRLEGRITMATAA